MSTVGDTLPQAGTVFDWDVAEILTRRGGDMGEFYSPPTPSELEEEWDCLLEGKRQDWHYKELLAHIEEVGFTQPLHATLEHGELRLCDGHHRIAVALELGIPTVPVEVFAFSVYSDDSGAWRSPDDDPDEEW